jgi:hypothetical protein
MPTYQSRCLQCGADHEYYQSIANCMTTPECCGASTQKVILTAPTGIMDIPAYVSPVTGHLIDSRAKRREDLARTGSRPWEGMEQETKVARQRAAEVEKKSDAAIESAVVSAWQSLPSEKRRVLESAT